jgi:hypothetical protein
MMAVVVTLMVRRIMRMGVITMMSTLITIIMTMLIIMIITFTICILLMRRMMARC